MNTAPPVRPSDNGHEHSPDHGRERLMDLLVSQATQGLSPHEASEMSGLLERHPDVDPQMFELAAARAALSVVGESDRDVHLPDHLRRRLIASYAGDDWKRDGAAALRSDGGRTVAGRIGLGRLALAACLGLVAGVGLMALLGRDGGSRAVAGAASADAPAATLDAMERFARSTPDAVRIAMKGAAAGYEGAVGEVVWSDREQAGYFRVAKLAPNDRSVSQYQLWIVDPSRDAKPVDGGVFDVRPGESVVKIAAKLRVEKPAVFAITKEKAGGVVVSAGPLLVVAAR